MMMELSEVLAKKYLERQEARVKLDAAEVQNVSADKCRQMVRMRTKCRPVTRIDMEKIEGWNPHPTRKNTFIIPSEFICLIV